MAKTDAQLHRQARLQNPTVKSHLAYILLSGFALMVMYTLLRIGLLVYNREMIGDTPASTFLEALFNGTRFDLRLTVYLLIPLVLSLFSARAMAARGFFRFWLTLVGSITLFFGLMEMDFYREFHQRLNGLVFQYVKEDPKTVLSMLWYGFPVVRYLLAWAIVTWLLSLVFKGIDRLTRPRHVTTTGTHNVSSFAPWYMRLGVFVLVLLVMVVCIRGTLRQGPPPRRGGG
ncbi:hypothetical protein Pav631_2066, partial [Pseudomonas avellanae BPIC 631]